MKKQTLFLLVLMLSVFVQSCQKSVIEDFSDVDNVEVENWSPTYILPILDTTFYLQDYLGELDEFGTVDIASDGLISLKYSDELFSSEGREMVEIPDFSLPILLDNVSIPTSELPFEYELTTADLKEGTMKYQFTNSYQQDLTVILRFENLKNNGVSFTETISVDWNGNPEVDGTIDLKGYALDFSDEMITVGYEATNSDGVAVYFQDLEYVFSDLEYSYVQGNFGQLDFDLPADALDFDIYSEDIDGGSLFLEDPVIRLNFQNSFGVPVQLKANGIIVETHNAGMMPLYSDLDDGFDFAYPSLNEVGEYSNSILELNKDNSNFNEILAANPYRLAYDLGALTDPNGTGMEGFLMDDSQFKVDMDIEIPLWFRLETLKLETVEDFKGEDLDVLEEATFYLKVENGLPIDGSLQVFFEDDNGNVLDVLMAEEEMILVSGELNSEGRVINPVVKETEIEVPASRLDAIMNATKVRFKPTVSTTNGGDVSVKIYEDYQLGISLGVKATVN